MPCAETGADSRVPFRKMVRSREELEKDLNKYKNFSNIYHSIYWFSKTEEKYDYLTGKTSEGPDYESAIIDKVVLDIDSYEKTMVSDRKFESYTQRGLDDMRKLEAWAEELDLLREYRFSGGGFYFIFSASGHPLKLRDFEIQLNNKLDINIDISTIGDTSRLVRVTNSFNFKNHRGCYCIPLKKEELELDYHQIKSLASEPRYTDRFIYGTQTHNFDNCKINQEKIKLKKLRIDLSKIKGTDANDILKSYGWEMEDFCDCIKGVLSLNYKGHYLRFELIKYLKTVVKMSFEDTVKLMVIVLGGEGLHSAVEGQAKHVYGRNKVLNPDWKLRPLGYCNHGCNLCVDMKKELRNILKEK